MRMPAATASARRRAAASSSPVKPISRSPSPAISAAATDGSPARWSRAAATADSSPRTRTRRTAPTRRRASISARRPWARTRPRSRMASDVHSSSSSGRMWLLIEDRLAQRPQLAEELAQLDPGARVQAGRRLVEDQDGGVVDERMGQAEALLHAPRERRHVGVPLVAEVDELEQVADHPAAAVRRQAVAAPEEVQVLPDLHVVVDAEAVRHVPDDAAHAVGVAADRGPGHLGIAGRRDEQRGQDPERRRLARPVGPHEAEDLAGRDLEVEAAEGQRAVVALDEPAGGDDGGHSILPSSWRASCRLTRVLAIVRDAHEDGPGRRVDEAGRPADVDGLSRSPA